MSTLSNINEWIAYDMVYLAILITCAAYLLIFTFMPVILVPGRKMLMGFWDFFFRAWAACLIVLSCVLLMEWTPAGWMILLAFILFLLLFLLIQFDAVRNGVKKTFKPNSMGVNQ